MEDFRETWHEKKPGLIERAISALRNRSKSPVESRGAVELSQPEAITTLLPNKLLPGWSVPVVGESFYQESFQKLYELSSKPGNEAILTTATLQIDPDNDNSPSGKAVAVFIHGQKVGHIAERICAIVFDGLERLGGTAECQCSVHFDTTSRERRYNSVDLRMVLPPTLASESVTEKVASLKRGQVLYRVGLFKLHDNAGSLLQELTAGQVMFLTTIFRGSQDSLVVTTVEGQEMFRSHSLESPLPFSLPPGGVLYYLETKALSLGGGTFEISILGSDPIKPEKTRTGDSVSDAGNVLSSRYDIGLIPTGKWLKVKYDKSLLQAPESSLFTPDPTEPTKYFWARVSQGTSFWSPLGFRGHFYQSDIDKFTWNMNTVPSFWVLVRASEGEVSSKPMFEVAFDSEAEFTVFPQRPIVAARALTSRKPSVPLEKRQPKESEDVAPNPTFSSDFSLDSLKGREVATSGFDILELNYLTPVLASIGFHFGDSVTKSRTGLLLGGSDFNPADSGKARNCARFGIPIISVTNLRQKLETSLASDPRYQALCRYEAWLNSLGFSPPYSWRDTTGLFDFRTIDAVLMPGAALDDRSIFGEITFHAALVGLSESKFELGEFFEGLGGQVLDSVLIEGEASFLEGKSGLVMELHANGVFIGRTPANQTESLAESASIYERTTFWVRLDWLSAGRFKGSFSFFGAAT